jgi:hypothetical protein
MNERYAIKSLLRPCINEDINSENDQTVKAR